MAGGYRSYIRVLEHWANHGVPQMLGTIVSAVAIGLGISMWIVPATYIKSDTFNIVFKFASPYAWGTVYLVSALMVLAMVYTNPKTAQAPVIILACAFGLHGMMTIPQAAGGGLPSAIFMYIGMAWVCLATQLVCGVAKERIHEETPIDY